MKKLITFVYLFMAILMIVGCGTQNEDLSKGKEWVKSDKRGRIPKAVARFEAATEKEPDNAEAHYLLGYYDENATIERRAEQMVLAYKYDNKKYLKILIEEALRDRDENVRKSAAKALYDINKNMKSMMDPLIKTLKSKDSRDRDDAALVLSNLHNHKEVVDRLAKKDILEHKRMYTRFDAVRALGMIGDEQSIDPVMSRITALKIEGEKGEEPEVRQAAVVALREIAKRDIDISGTSLNIQVEPTGEGVMIAGNVPESIVLKKGEIISHVIDNRKITSLEHYNSLIMEELQVNGEITFGSPKIVKVTASTVEELGIEEGDIKPLSGKGIVIGKMSVESKARKMGLEKGETVSSINNQKVGSVADYKRVVNEAMANGEMINLTIANADKYRLVTIRTPKDNPDIGIDAKALPGGMEGVVVNAIRPRSPAVEAGVKKDQVFSYIVRKDEVKNVDDYNQLIKGGLVDGKVTISVINQKAIGKLIEVLRNKGLVVRFDAANALGEVKNSAAVDSLVEMLGEQANPIEIKL